MMDNLPEAFIKCNRSVILNLCYYKEYNMTSLMLVMDDDKVFKLARRNVKNFNTMRSKLSRISPPCTNCYNCIDEACESRVVFCRRKKSNKFVWTILNGIRFMYVSFLIKLLLSLIFVACTPKVNAQSDSSLIAHHLETITKQMVTGIIKIFHCSIKLPSIFFQFLVNLRIQHIIKPIK